MQINDLGDEAIREILAEAADGMRRRTGKGWDLNLDGVTGDLKMLSGKDSRFYGMANVRPAPFLSPVEPEPIGAVIPEAIAFRSVLRRKVLEATQAITPVPGASDIPAALARTFSAIAALDAVKEKVGANEVFALGHDLYRILDHLTGNDHSGCSSKPSVADYGRKLSDMPVRMVIHEEADEVPWNQPTGLRTGIA